MYTATYMYILSTLKLLNISIIQLRLCYYLHNHVYIHTY